MARIRSNLPKEKSPNTQSPLPPQHNHDRELLGRRRICHAPVRFVRSVSVSVTLPLGFVPHIYPSPSAPTCNCAFIFVRGRGGGRLRWVPLPEFPIEAHTTFPSRRRVLQHGVQYPLRRGEDRSLSQGRGPPHHPEWRRGLRPTAGRRVCVRYPGPPVFIGLHPRRFHSLRSSGSSVSPRFFLAAGASLSNSKAPVTTRLMQSGAAAAPFTGVVHCLRHTVRPGPGRPFAGPTVFANDILLLGKPSHPKFGTNRDADSLREFRNL